MLDRLAASPRLKNYFTELDTTTRELHNFANEAKKVCIDPEDHVAIPLTEDVAQRVEGLISSVAPQIIGKRIPDRIRVLEKQYGKGDWRIDLTIAK